jgi:hypothetical protein
MYSKTKAGINNVYQTASPEKKKVGSIELLSQETYNALGSLWCINKASDDGQANDE